MIKKLLLLGVALLSTANVAYGYDKMVSNPNNPDVVYGATKTTNINDGTLDTDITFSVPVVDMDAASVAFTMTTTKTYSDVNLAYSLTPVSFEGTDLSLSNWDVLGLSGKEIKDSYTEMTMNFIDGDGNITDQNLYDQYSYIVENAKSKIATQIVKAAGGYSAKSYKGVVYKGDYLLDLGYTEEEDETPLNSLLYYMCVQSTAKSGKIVKIVQIFDLAINLEEKITYEDGKTSYKVTSIPNNFITNKATTLKIPSSVSSIATNAFANASQLERIESASGKYPVKQYGDYYFLFEENSSKRTLIYATYTDSKVKAHEADFEDNVTAYKADALKFHYNLTINSYKLASKTLTNGNKIVNAASGAITNQGTKSTAHGTVKYLEVSGNVDQAELVKIINESWGFQYVVFTKEANITSNLDIEAAIASNNTANSTSWTSAQHNTIYFVAATTDKTVSGNNVVIGTSNGSCENFVLNEISEIFYNPYKFTASKAKMNRSIGGNYSTICLPFAVTSGLSTKFRFGHLSSFDASTNVFTFAIDQSMAAYTPNIIKASSGTSTALPTFYGVDIEVTPEDEIEATTTTADASFFGAMAPKTLDSNNATVNYYGFSNNQVVRANKATIKTFRSYLTGPKDSYNAGALRVIDFAGNEIDFIDIENSETAIESVTTENESDIIYNLNGELVENINNSGIYVVNGKKSLVK